MRAKDNPLPLTLLCALDVEKLRWREGFERVRRWPAPPRAWRKGGSKFYSAGLNGKRAVERRLRQIADGRLTTNCVVVS